MTLQNVKRAFQKINVNLLCDNIMLLLLARLVIVKSRIIALSMCARSIDT